MLRFYLTEKDTGYRNLALLSLLVLMPLGEMVSWRIANVIVLSLLIIAFYANYEYSADGPLDATELINFTICNRYGGHLNMNSFETVVNEANIHKYAGFEFSSKTVQKIENGNLQIFNLRALEKNSSGFISRDIRLLIQFDKVGHIFYEAGSEIGRIDYKINGIDHTDLRNDVYYLIIQYRSPNHLGNHIIIDTCTSSFNQSIYDMKLEHSNYLLTKQRNELNIDIALYECGLRNRLHELRNLKRSGIITEQEYIQERDNLFENLG